MVEKVPVNCPKCRVRLRMPLGLRAGKRPRCPKCKTIVRPADVLPSSLLVPVRPGMPDKPPVPVLPPPPPILQTTPPPSDFFTETKTMMPDGRAREVDPYAETVAKLPDPPVPEEPRKPIPSDVYLHTRTLAPQQDALRKPLPSDFFTQTRTMVPAEPVADSVPPKPARVAG